MPRFAVIGAGITGLSAAHRLLELADSSSGPLDLTVFEASTRYGGLFGSERVGDYLIELGADSFITNKPAAVGLCERLGIDLIPTDDRYRRSLILHRGRPAETPEGFNLLAPSKIGPLLKTPLLSWGGKLRVASEYFLPKGPEVPDESLASFVRRRFGQEVLDNIVQPLVGGIYTSDPEQLSLRATLPRFVEMERRHGSLIRALQQESRQARGQAAASGARYGLFATPREGMQVLLDTLKSRLAEHVSLKFGQRIQRVLPCLVEGSKGWQLEFENQSPEIFDGVILATAAYQAADLLASTAPDLSSALKEIEYASSAIVVSGHRLSDVTHPCTAFGLVIPHKERRRILATSFLSRKFPGRAPEDRIIMRTFVGGAMQPEELECTDDQLVSKVLEELNSILGVHGEPEFVKIAHYRRSMPQYTVGHLGRVGRIRELSRQIHCLALAGNAFDGVGVPDSIASGEAAARSVWEQVFSGPKKGPAVA